MKFKDVCKCGECLVCYVIKENKLGEMDFKQQINTEEETGK